MGFLALPTEVLRQVLQESEPDDFEIVMLTCKRVHAAGLVFMAEHNNYRRLFRNIHIQLRAEWGNYFELLRALAELLRIIAADPRAAAYIRILSIQECLYNMPHRDGIALRLGGSEGSSAELELSSWTSVEDMILDSPWLRAAGCDLAAWVALVTTVRDANESRGLTHLETLHVKYDLHNPSSGNVEEGSPVLSQARKVLDIMSICVGNSSSPSIDKVLFKVSGLPPSPLERLAELNYCPPAGLSRATELIALNPFMASPKLRRLRVTNLRVASNLDHVYTWPASRYSTLTGTGSQSSVQGGDPQRPFADAMPVLLASQASRDSRSADLKDPDLASRITDLSVGFESLLGHIVTGVTGATIKQFTSLKRLALDVRVFLGPNPDSGEKRELRTNLDPDESSWDLESDIPRLIDVLPRTLESLELFVEMQDRQWSHFDIDYWTRLLMGFREELLGLVVRISESWIMRTRAWCKIGKPCQKQGPTLSLLIGSRYRGAKS
ncbi:hypothetical protein KJ359_008000 [Pestalotiopsis sp. 9143b]|nr:hypothetical protein KJ359_008000 [Pestalotiopsis sp. 9143b]